MRKQAQRLAGEIAQGQNPAEKRRAIRDEMTFEELFAIYLEKHAKVHKRTWQQDADEFRLYLGGLRRLKISSTTRPQLVAIHAEIGERAESTVYRQPHA